jgi:hypothetical protein
MVDFKDIFRVRSKIVQRNNKIPKVLQLSISTRSDLRKKIASFFERVPKEDLV